MQTIKQRIHLKITQLMCSSLSSDLCLKLIIFVIWHSILAAYCNFIALYIAFVIIYILSLTFALGGLNAGLVVFSRFGGAV